MRLYLSLLAIVFVATILLHAQEADSTKPKRLRANEIPTSALISQPGPSFRISEAAVRRDPRLIVYGDQRFTDPANTKVTNPKVRRWLVKRIADEHPSAVLMNGDVPYSGDVENDYAFFKTETQVWRDEHLNVYPALGNHEFHGDPYQALEHWWTAFPELRNRRWYSVELGKSIYTIALDSDTSLLQGSDQWKWLDAQLMNLPKTTRFVILSLHHPPVADFQTRYSVDHNPRPNEIALRDYLESVAPQLKAQIIVSAGHIHNYERIEQKGITFLVAGGGAASPVKVDRAPDDLYQDPSFPNYSFVEFVLKGHELDAKMYRLTDADADTPAWEIKDSFTIHSK